MTGSRDRDVLDRLEKLEQEQEATRKWRRGIDALVNKGKGFWLAVILIGSAAATLLGTNWSKVRHLFGGVAGG